MSADPFWIKEGNTGKPLVRTLKNADGSAIDLTLATVTLQLRKLKAGTLLVADGECSIVGDPTDGTVQYDWDAADTAPGTAGTYRAEFDATLGDGTKITVPNTGDMVVTIVPSVD